MRITVALVVLLAGCPSRTTKDRGTLADPVAGTTGNAIAAMVAELQDDVLSSYERDEPPDVETGMIPVEIGGARIGVGPGDVLIAGELERAPSRWPLRVESDTPTEIRSKRLETHLAQDQSAAWVFDELSWRLSLCGRTAVVPLRVTMLYARDGDRWVPIFEHMSFGHAPAPRRDGELYGTRIASKVVATSDIVDELSAVMSPVLSLGANRNAGLATGPEAMLLGPDVAAEWHGVDVLGARLVPGPAKAVEDRRIGLVGRGIATATVAYWIGNVVANLPARPGVAAGKVRLRTTFVFEHRRVVKSNADPRFDATPCGVDDEDCRWVLVQGHVSQPIGDQELATRVFGTALLSSSLESGEPLSVTCEDGSTAQIRVPEVAPLPAPPPAARNP
ncbi:MAG: hypothetical protein H0T42_19615 [Deltaproteobacteria bacterium]|nr:hypothetical protein [Deltaproteobacteria bacterium]